MGSIPVPDHSWRNISLNNFTGGLTFTQNNDSECEIFDNWEMLREGSPTTRLGVEKVNSTNIGTAMVVGMGFVTTGTSSSQTLIVAKTGTTWWKTNLPITVAATTFTSISVPESPGNDPVRMETVADTSDTSWAVFVNKNFTGVIKYDGTTASVAASSPANQQYIRWFSSRLYVAGNPTKPRTIRFSESADPFSWPTTNEFIVPARYGIITGLEAHSGRLFIFCQRGILQMVGSPPDDFEVSNLHDQIGCNIPGSISTYGTSTAFMGDRSAFILSGSVKNLSERLYGPKLTGAAGSDQLAYGALTPFHYIIRRSMNNNTTPLTNGTAEMLVLDRHFDSWGTWLYPATTSLGASAPYQSIVISMPGIHTDLLLSGGDGNIYNQSTRVVQAYDLTNSTVLFSVDYDGATGVAVTSRLRTRQLPLGSPAVQKQLGEILVAGQGTATSFKVRMFDSTYTLREGTVATNKVLPFRTRNPQVGDTTMRTVWGELQLDISLQRSVLKEMMVAYRPRRFSIGGALS